MLNGFVRRSSAVVLTIMAAGALIASPADARSWSVTGGHGRTWSGTSTHYNNGGGNFGRTVTETRPNGQTATSTFNRSVSGGTITDSKTVTGFNGKTASGTFTRTPGQGWSADYTGRGGKTRSATGMPQP